MAERPVFVPLDRGQQFVQEVPINFRWHSGMAVSQKKKNIDELHRQAEFLSLSPLLEVSSKSDLEAGRRLSAFHQTLNIEGQKVTVECAFQGSKIFENGGPYSDLFYVTSREAKRDVRLHSSGRLIGFSFLGKEYPLSPPTIFYDWLYIKALYPHRVWLERLGQFAGFTDIEFNPERSLNCQARSCALFVALLHRGQVEESMSSFEAFCDTVVRASL